MGLSRGYLAEQRGAPDLLQLHRRPLAATQEIARNLVLRERVGFVDVLNSNARPVETDARGPAPVLMSFGPGANPNAEPTGAGLTRGIIGLTNLGQSHDVNNGGFDVCALALEEWNLRPLVLTGHLGLQGSACL